ncbi:glycosyltransferase [Gluconacetobacter sp. 1c LMG 22058]|uniref:Glycosyltransferase n=1 Tax=Gluconacetobacter dulcium TaxID=2729096 RepID=A0A7W4JZB2_9PROT|nr:glycosyltransferase [Gluconacetobacter dulcium]MBB2197511.1 glycosyltransferase [Gluconacetobacter dulcium]
MITDKRFFLVTPWPPSKSGVADVAYSQAIFLRNAGVQLTIVTDVEHPTEIEGVDIICVDDLYENKIEKEDIFIHHIGNNYEYHSFMLRAIGDFPGFVVLHDLSYIDLFIGLYLPGAAGAFHKFVEKYYGYDAARNISFMLNNNKLFSRRDIFLQFPFFEPFLEGSKGAVVYSDFGRSLVEERMPQISVIRASMDFADIDRDLFLRKKTSIPNNENKEVKLASFGHLGLFKRPYDIVGALKGLPLDLPWSFSFVGPASPELMRSLKAVMPDEIAARVHFTGAIDDASFEQHLLTTDLAVQLRWPTMGETSAVVRRCLQAGVPLLVTDYGSLSEVPESCLRIPHQAPKDILHCLLFEVVSNQDCRDTLRASALEIMKTFSPTMNVKTFLESIIKLSSQDSARFVPSYIDILNNFHPHPSVMPTSKIRLTDSFVDYISEWDDISDESLGGKISADNIRFENVRGFYIVEDQEAFSFRWTLPEFMLPVYLSPKVTYRIHANFLFNCDVVISGSRVYENISVTEGQKFIDFTIPEDHENNQTISVRMSTSKTIGEIFSNPDGRVIGCQFYFIEILKSSVKSDVLKVPNIVEYHKWDAKSRLFDTPDFFQLETDKTGSFRWLQKKTSLQVLASGRKIRLEFGRGLGDTPIDISVNGIWSRWMSYTHDVTIAEIPIESDRGGLLKIDIVVKSPTLATIPDNRLLGTRLYSLEIL